MRELAVLVVRGIDLNPILIPYFRLHVRRTQHLEGRRSLMTRPLPRLHAAISAKTNKGANALRIWTTIFEIHRHDERRHTRVRHEIHVGACRGCVCVYDVSTLAHSYIHTVACERHDSPS